MKIENRVVATLIALFALRRVRDYFTKPVGFAAVVSIMAHVAEFTVHGAFVMAPWERIATATISTAPFMAVVFFVVTYLDRMQLQLGQMATTDVLTGLPNRRDFMDRASRHLARLDSAPRGVVLLLDADHFKRINDSWGHGVGDLCLAAIANRMRKELRAGDYLGRIGGEEFSAFLPETTLEDAVRIGTRLTASITVEPGRPAGRLTFTLSVGAAEVTEGMDLHAALEVADQALYLAKTNGRSRLEVWSGGSAPGAAA